MNSPILSSFQLRKESILQERSAQCDMDIQTLLSGILPLPHFKHGYIYNHVVELSQSCGQHYGHVCLEAISFRKLCVKLWCITLLIVKKGQPHFVTCKSCVKTVANFGEKLFLDFF